MNILIQTHKDFNFILPVFLLQILGQIWWERWLLFLNDTQLFFFLSGKHLIIGNKSFQKG